MVSCPGAHGDLGDSIVEYSSLTEIMHEKIGGNEDRRLVVKLGRVFETAALSFVKKRFHYCG